MKISAIPAVLSVVLSAAFSYLTYTINEGYDACMVLTIGSFIGFVATLLPAMSISTPNGRAATNMKTASSIMFVIMLLVVVFSTIFKASTPVFVIFVTILVVCNIYSIWRIHVADVD